MTTLRVDKETQKKLKLMALAEGITLTELVKILTDNSYENSIEDIKRMVEKNYEE